MYLSPAKRRRTYWVVFTLTVVAVLAAAPPAAQGSAAHPKLLVSGEEPKPSHVKTTGIDWGMIQLKNRSLGNFECVTLGFGTYFNNTEPGRTGEGTESIRAYGEQLGWSATSFANSAGLEPLPHCKYSAGFIAWESAEPRPSTTAEVATNLNGNATERLVLAGPFGASSTHREPPDLPWLEEAEGTENPETHFKTFFLRTGVPISSTERAQVEAEESAAGVPTERRTGCYHNPLFTEIVRAPGFTSAHETELALRPGPDGCVNMNVIAPAVGVEIPFTGSLEPEFINGAKNGQNPSIAEFFGGAILPSEERSSERNERELVSIYGPGFMRSVLPTKRVGYLKEELLKLG